MPRLSGAGGRASAQAENGPSPSGRAGVSGWGCGAGRWAAILEDTVAAVWSHLTPPLASQVSPPSAGCPLAQGKEEVEVLPLPETGEGLKETMDLSKTTALGIYCIAL